MFLRVAEAVCRDRELARDAVQDAFAAALRSRRSYRGDGSLEAWVWRMVVNSARKARRPPLRDVRAGRREGDAVEPRDTGMVELLTGLPDRQRLAVFLRYYADLDYGAIADVLEVSPGTVGATLTAARRSLRRALEEVLV